MGWPSKRLSDSKAAAREARQEAGVTGKIASESYGQYLYRKRTQAGPKLIEVFVFVLRVRKASRNWREKNERQRVWLDLQTASRRVREPKLRAIIASLTSSNPAD